MSWGTQDLIERLIGAWGDAGEIASLVAEDAEWWITPTTDLPSPMVGREQIAETMKRVFGEIYDPSRTRTGVHMTLGQGHFASARFTMFSHVLLVDRPYENEYALFIQSDPTGTLIQRVWEYLDVKHAIDQLDGGEQEGR